ncbi:MAG: homocysteine S-methyltransferase family protein [Sarcina sp.]
MEVKDRIGKELLVFDGAMGTMLQKRGLKLGENPEIFNIKNPEVILEIHKKYIEAGAMVVTTNTFGANERKLKETGYEVEEIIGSAVTIAKKATVGSESYVALDIGPIGELLESMGTLSFDDAYEIFKRQVVAGVKNSVDLIIIETMTDLYEAKAAVLAAKENSNLPILVTMTFEANERTFTGCTPEAMALTLEGLAVDGIGVNCSLGPKELLPVIKRIRDVTNLPLMVQANAGLPKVIDGKTIFNVKEEEFAEGAEKFFENGVSILGGCCGTTDLYIKKIVEKLKGKEIIGRKRKEIFGICSDSKVVYIDGVRVVGERINPTGKKLFKEALIKGDMDYVLNQAIEQIEAGAEILDVNVGVPQINEEEVMVRTIKEIQGIIDAPLQIDSTSATVIEKALRYYNGKPIVNSVNGEIESLEKILPLVKKYGASVIGLTLDNKGIPAKAEERVEIAKKIIEKAKEYGIARENVFIDCLVLTASAQQKEVKETLKAVTMVKENFGVKTLLGVSNISFGLPNRKLINESFLALALGAGLDLPIMNPNAEGMMDVIRAYRVLNNEDVGAEVYIEKYGNDKKEFVTNLVTNSDFDLKEIVIKGLKNEARIATEKLLKNKEELTIVNEYLIPALDEVGDKYEKEIIFLPQLIRSAETVKVAFEVLKESLNKSNSKSISKGKIVLATVKGDIHDIGKNIVKVILENYGYEVIDLGKDVPIERVLEIAKTEKPKLVGLSALMTTTLKSMEETIKAIKKEGIDTKVMVGGAVLTKEYAEIIGADYYSKDAREAVEIAKEIFN